MVDIYQTANWEITYPPLSSTVWYIIVLAHTLH